MISIDPTFLLFLLGWAIFMPFICVFVGWYARGAENERVDAL